MIGEVGGTLENAINDIVARNFLPRLYAEVAKQFLGEFPKSKKELTNIAYVGELWDNHKELRKQINEAFQVAKESVPFYSSPERGGGGKISQAAMDGANKYFAGGKQESVAKFIEEQCGYVAQRDEDNAVTIEGLARGIQALERHLKRVSEQQTKAALERAAQDSEHEV